MWSRIPKLDGIKASKHWLANLEPEKEAKRRKRFAEFQHKIESSLAKDKNLSIWFREVVEIAHWLGRVDGLREGLELYEYGLRIERDKTPAFRAVMRYALSNPDKLSAPEICAHLDREILRIKELKTAAPLIGPPEQWGYQTWGEALKKKRNNVDVLFNEAKNEALSQRYATLMAWATWGRKRKKKASAAGSEA